MFGYSREDDTQLHFEFTWPEWRQLELFSVDETKSHKPLEPPFNENGIIYGHGEMAVWDASAGAYTTEQITAANVTSLAYQPQGTLTFRTSDTPQASLYITDDIQLQTTQKRPGPIVRFFHKVLLGFTWEDL